MAEEIAPGVITLDHRVVEGKNVVVFGRRGAVAIDCGSDAAEGRASLHLMRSRRAESIWLAMTHCHGDHAMGSGCFREAASDVIAHAGFSDNLRRHLARRLRQPRDGAGEVVDGVDSIGETLAWPTVTFSDELRIDLGGKVLRFLHTPGHSADSCCAFLEEGRILFGGDTVVTCIPPTFGDGDSRDLERSLRGLADVEAEVLVPGHGPVLRGEAAIRAHLEWLVGYLETTRAAVEQTRTEERDRWIEAALRAAPRDDVYESRLDVERHGNAGRHAATVGKLVDEAVSGAAQ